MMTCHAFLGPASFIPMDPKIGLEYFSVTTFGMGLAMVGISAITRAKKTAISLNYSDDVQLYLAISGKKFR